MRDKVKTVALLLVLFGVGGAQGALEATADVGIDKAWSNVQSGPLIPVTAVWFALLTSCGLYLFFSREDNSQIQAPLPPLFFRSQSPDGQPSQPWISTSEESELKGASEAMATAAERWVAYRDVSLWSSPELSVGHELARLDRGSRVEVLSTNHFGMAEILTQDSRQGWVRTIELTSYEPGRVTEEQKIATEQPVAVAQADPAMVPAPTPMDDPALGYMVYSSAHPGDQGEAGLLAEPVEKTGGFFHGIFDAIGNAFSSIGDAIGDIDFGDMDFGGFD
jgi:hypothetical protein